jgi:tetratricopeptide (TPR) repeat protein
MSARGKRRAELLSAQADALHVRSERGSTSDRDEAIRLRRLAADEFGSGTQWLMTLLTLRDQLMERWQADKRSADLDEVLDVDAALMPDLEDHERVMLLRSQIRQLWDRLNRSGPLEDLDRIIEAARKVGRLARPPAHQDLSDLCYFLQLRYARTRDVADLDEAAAAGRRAVGDPSAHPGQQAVHLSNLFGAVIKLAEANESSQAFTEAVQVAERAVGLCPPDSPARTMYLANLSTALCARFQAAGDQDDLDRSVACGQRAFDASRPDDPGFSELRASLLMAWTLKFDRCHDDTALDQALAVLRRGDMDPSAGWLQSLKALIDALTQRIGTGREPGPGQDVPIWPRQVRDGLLRVYEEGLMLMSTQLMGTGAAVADLGLVDDALEVLREAAGLGGELRRTMYRSLRGEVLIRRWQITKARNDLDTAIDLLIEAAADFAAAGDSRELAVQSGMSAANALVRRFRRRRHAQDLREAERQLERAMTLLPASQTEWHDEMRALQKYIRSITARPPLMLNYTELGESDREDLSSPLSPTNRLAWSEGRPRFSGLTWVHTREDEAGLDARPGGDRRAGRRVLFLRTFLDDDSNFVILNSLALSLDNRDRIEIVGDASDRPLVEKYWQLAFGPGARPESRLDFITSTDDGWRRAVLDRICRADAIVLFISPKDADFPDFAFPPTTNQIGASEWERFMDAPLAQPLTGPGLLREICYLNRLRRLPDTVVMCDSKYQPALEDLIALGGMMGDSTDVAGNLVTPRLAAADKQLGHLRKAFRGITYGRPENSVIMPNLAQAVRQALRDIVTDGPARRAAPWAPADLCGTSPHPRRLPPDNELKVIACTDVENIFFLPVGEIIEIDHPEMLGTLSRAAVRKGCPYCRAPIDQMFFYRRGLERHRSGSEPRRASCQVCGRRSSLQDDWLEPM